MNRQLVELAVELLAISIVVAVLARRWRVPYSVFLIIVGLGIGFLRETLGLQVGPVGGVSLSKDLILIIFLPPLLFEGTIHMDLEILRRHLLPVSLLALVGTLLASGLIGLSLIGVFGFALPAALLMATMVAPTDPVSVLALFKEEGVDKNLSTLIEGESVFNDGIAVVLYLIFLRIVSGDTSVTVAGAGFEFVREIVLGGGVGLLLGYVSHRILGRLEDRFTEITISVVLSWGVYVAAEHLHASGVIAVVAAGLVIGNFGQVLSMSPTTRLALIGFWEVIAFLVNSILFLLMGLASDLRQIMNEWKLVLFLFATMILVRSAVVYGLIALMNRWRRPIPLSWQHIINWGGLRGSIPIALVLGLPVSLEIAVGGRVLEKSHLTHIVTGVVLLSLLIQGLTISRLLRYFGFTGQSPDQEQYELLCGRTVSLKAAREALSSLHVKGEVSDPLYRAISEELKEQLDQLSSSTASLLAQHYELKEAEFRKISQALLLAERAALSEAVRQGLLSEETVEHLTEEIDSKIDDKGTPFYADWQIDEEPDLPA